MSMLDQLRATTSIVADSGDCGAIAEYLPDDVSTNSSCLLKAAKMPRYRDLVQDAVRFGKMRGDGDTFAETQWTMDKLAVNFGTEILKIIPGRVSTEVDARLSFDTEGIIRRVEGLVGSITGPASIPGPGSCSRSPLPGRGFAPQSIWRLGAFDVTSRCCSASPRRSPARRPGRL